MHPHIAPLATNVPANFSRPPGTTRFNWQADGVWNHGEGFPAGSFAPDHGGFRDADDANVQITDIHPYLDASGVGGWAPMSGHPTVNRFVGYLRPQAPIANGAKVEDAAFEVFAPAVRDHNLPLVVVIGLWATAATPFRAGVVHDQFLYPGFDRPDGLVPADGNLPAGDIKRPAAPEYFVEHPPNGYQVMYAYIVPRNFGRPTVIQMQRAVQLAKAVDLMLTSQLTWQLLPPGFDPFSPHHQSPPKLATGGSLGGMCAQLAVVLRPDIFHGASSQVFSGSLGRMPGEQFTLNYIGRGTGITLNDTSLNINDSLEWGFYLRQMGSDYFNASTTLRHRRNELVRPMVHLIGDEDTVTNGVDWLPYLTGTRSFPGHGVSPSGSPSPNIMAWTVVDRRCHGEGGPITTAIGGVPLSDINDATIELIPFTYASWATSVPATPPTLVDDGSEDCYAHALARGPFSNTPPPTNAFLELDPQFGPNGQGRTVGQGLSLGVDESIRGYPMNLPGETGDSIFVGSFDGIVTRYVRNPTTDELVVAGQSESLGHGAWSLDVGDLTANNAGPEVVVGTMRAIHVLDAATLVRIGGIDLDFEHEAPRRIKIAKVHTGGGSVNKEVVFLTFHGHLMVLKHDLTVLTDLGEPGIQDFVVHEGTAYAHATTSSQVPITLMSHRGHLVNVTLSDESAYPALPEAEVHCWTVPQIGAASDLEAFDVNGQRLVAASYRRTEATVHTIETFDALTLVAVAGYGQGAVEIDGDIADIECVHDTQGKVAGFALIEKDYIWWIPRASNTMGVRKGVIATFSPAFRPVSLRAIDVLPGSSGFQEELVLTTLSGHVVWLEASALVAMSGPPPLNIGALTLPRPAAPGTFNQAFPHTNRSVAGTWGMVSKMVCLDDETCLWRIYAANQAGELFEVDPQNGAFSWLADMRDTYEVGPQTFAFPGLPYVPVRDLVVMGEPISTVRAHADRARIIPAPPSIPPPNVWWLETRPWMNAHQQPYAALWYQHPSVAGLQDVAFPPLLPVYDYGLAPFSGGGAITGKGLDPNGELIRQAHWWGGESDTYPNLVQGAYVSGPLATPQIADTWYSTKINVNSYGTSTAACKDLRNNVKNDDGSTFNLQSLRLGVDGTGTVIALNTSGGGVILMRPGQPAIPTPGAPGTAPGVDMGAVPWDASTTPTPPLDDGFGGMALATRQVPGEPTCLDIFAGTALTYPDPSALPPASSGLMVSAVRWLRWDGSTMTPMGAPLLLEPTPNDPRGGFAVCGLAVGNIVDANEGSELVVTTMAGDLYVYALGGSGFGNQLLHTWVPGSLGAYNSIMIEDLDFDLRNEVYVAGSQGIWKWRQK